MVVWPWLTVRCLPSADSPCSSKWGGNKVRNKACGSRSRTGSSFKMGLTWGELGVLLIKNGVGSWEMKPKPLFFPPLLLPRLSFKLKSLPPPTQQCRRMGDRDCDQFITLCLYSFFMAFLCSSGIEPFISCCTVAISHGFCCSPNTAPARLCASGWSSILALLSVGTLCAAASFRLHVEICSAWCCF